MFAEVDEDGDKKITWEEFSDALFKRDPKEVHQAELEETFEKFDKDGSGKISKEELKAVIEGLGYNVSDEGLQNVMDAADPDGNGVDFQEFLKTWNCGH